MDRRLRVALAAFGTMLTLVACGGGPPPDEGPLPEQEQRSEERAASEAQSSLETES